MENHAGNELKKWNRLLLTTAAIAVVALPIFAGTESPVAQSSQGTAARPQEAGKNGIGYPSCIYCPRPSYSDQALRAKFEGDVRLQATITAEGRAVNIKVVNSPGLGLDKQATDALKEWRFKPALEPDGKAVAVDIPVEVAFHLPKNVSEFRGARGAPTPRQ